MFKWRLAIFRSFPYNVWTCFLEVARSLLVLSAQPLTGENPRSLVPPGKASPTDRSPVLPSYPSSQSTSCPGGWFRRPKMSIMEELFQFLGLSFGRSHKLCVHQFSHLHLPILRSSGLGFCFLAPWATATLSLRGWWLCLWEHQAWEAFQRCEQSRSQLLWPSLWKCFASFTLKWWAWPIGQTYAVWKLGCILLGLSLRISYCPKINIF